MQSHVASVVMFNGLNFAEWSEQVLFHLGALDLDLALLKDKPVIATPTGTGTGTGTGTNDNTGNNNNNTGTEVNVTEQCSLKDWERSNRLSSSDLLPVKSAVMTTRVEAFSGMDP